MRFASIALLALSFACATPRSNVQPLLASTVQVRVRIGLISGWVGSGVVYEKTSGADNQVHSKILTANHVLDVKGIAAAQKVDLEGLPVEMDIYTHDGRVCDLKVVQLGDLHTGDVAVAEADCDAGPVATIADRLPPEGAEVFISGHPLGFPVAVVTGGWTSGWIQGYLLVSAGSAGGNSGGPVWYNGQVIGLLVRGTPAYPNISLVVPLAKLKERIAQADSLEVCL